MPLGGQLTWLNIRIFWVKAHYGGGQIVVTLYRFLKVPCLNFNHVIVMKDFHNVFAYYGKSKAK
jgi:hypothetical protein